MESRSIAVIKPSGSLFWEHPYLKYSFNVANQANLGWLQVIANTLLPTAQGVLSLPDDHPALPAQIDANRVLTDPPIQTAAAYSTGNCDAIVGWEGYRVFRDATDEQLDLNHNQEEVS